MKKTILAIILVFFGECLGFAQETKSPCSFPLRVRTSSENSPISINSMIERVPYYSYVFGEEGKGSLGKKKVSVIGCLSVLQLVGVFQCKDETVKPGASTTVEMVLALSLARAVGAQNHVLTSGPLFFTAEGVLQNLFPKPSPVILNDASWIQINGKRQIISSASARLQLGEGESKATFPFSLHLQVDRKNPESPFYAFGSFPVSVVVPKPDTMYSFRMVNPKGDVCR